MCVLVCPAGAEGQIALRLVKELAAAGEKVVAGTCLDLWPLNTAGPSYCCWAHAAEHKPPPPGGTALPDV
jgi:hypothetical protein